jgi:hypothetical protein
MVADGGLEREAEANSLANVHQAMSEASSSNTIISRGYSK